VAFGSAGGQAFRFRSWAAARAFCERNGIALAAFAIDHVMAEWHAEAAAWLATPRQVRAEYRRAV
jgi:hypothetical protein